MSVGTAIEWTHRSGTVPATMDALSEKALLEPLTKRKPHTYFVNSMSDLFYEGVSDEWIDRHYAVFALCPQHTFIVLTKRPERMQKYLSDPGLYDRLMQTLGEIVFEVMQDDSPYSPQQAFEMLRETVTDSQPEPGQRISFTFKVAKLPLPNVWHLVSVEDQKSADERIPLLLRTPSAVRGVSCEPLLGPIRTRGIHNDEFDLDYLTGELIETDVYSERKRLPYGPGLDWWITGGESGAGARPMHPDWARGLRDQCQAAGVPFFFKQWGEHAPWEPKHPVKGVLYMKSDGTLHPDPLGAGVTSQPVVRVGKKAAGHLLDGREWHQFPEVGQC